MHDGHDDCGCSRNFLLSHHVCCAPLMACSRHAQDWYGSMNLMTFLRETGRFARVGTMLAKDSVRTRLESPQGISFTEFCYQLLCASQPLQMLLMRHFSRSTFSPLLTSC